ncbi:MAG: hypothetical protein WCT37_03625 [Patescibacteria group bacterium]|jgi:hypothetical protein
MSKPIKIGIGAIIILAAAFIGLAIWPGGGYSQLEEGVKNARYGDSCGKIVGMSNIAGYPIPIKTANGEEIYQVFFYNINPSYPVPPPGQEPRILTPSVVAEIHTNAPAVCAAFIANQNTEIKQSYGPRYSSQANDLSLSALDRQRADLFLVTKKTAASYFAGDTSDQAKATAKDFYDKFILLSEPGFHQFYYDLNPNFWQWLGQLTGKTLVIK